MCSKPSVISEIKNASSNKVDFNNNLAASISDLNIVSWNTGGSISNLPAIIEQLKNNNVHILAIQETKRGKNGHIRIEQCNYKFYNSGTDSTHGCGFMVLKQIIKKKFQVEFKAISGRLCTLRILDGQGSKLTLINCYAPPEHTGNGKGATKRNRKAKLKFYKCLKKLVENEKSTTPELMLLGDFNARIWKEDLQKVNQGLVQNTNGAILTTFSKIFHFKFKTKDRTYTFKMRGKTGQERQLDHIMVNDEHENCVSNTEYYCKLENFEHRMIGCTIQHTCIQHTCNWRVEKFPSLAKKLREIQINEQPTFLLHVEFQEGNYSFMHNPNNNTPSIIIDSSGILIFAESKEELIAFRRMEVPPNIVTKREYMNWYCPEEYLAVDEDGFKKAELISFMGVLLYTKCDKGVNRARFTLDIWSRVIEAGGDLGALKRRNGILNNGINEYFDNVIEPRVTFGAENILFKVEETFLLEVLTDLASSAPTQQIT